MGNCPSASLVYGIVLSKEDEYAIEEKYNEGGFYGWLEVSAWADVKFDVDFAGFIDYATHVLYHRDAPRVEVGAYYATELPLEDVEALKEQPFAIDLDFSEACKELGIEARKPSWVILASYG